MAVRIPYVTERDGVFYYTRRVPKIVCDRPGALEQHFGGQHTVRVSLMTSDPVTAFRLAAERGADFERRVSAALDAGAVAVPRPLQAVTQDHVAMIREQRRYEIERSFRNLVIQREGGGEMGQLAAEMLDWYEMEAATVSGALNDHGTPADNRFDFDEIAARVIQDEGLDAPRGSAAFAAIRLALRESEMQGRRDGFDIVYGRKPLIADDVLPPPQRAATIMTISEAVGVYVKHQPNKRTINGINEALRCFVAVVGDQRLDQLTAVHFRSFCEAEAALDVGGASKGSIRRPKSAATIKKKLSFLRAAISHVMDKGMFAGPNPAAGIQVGAFARPVSKAIMPDKRPFSITELALVLRYPWFTGCVSDSHSRRHEPGNVRLGGMWYWGPIVALLTGCRAGEIGGLALDEVRLDDPCPHFIIRDNKFRTTKGGYQRKVPLLDQLLETGFAEHVSRLRSRGAIRLFDDWKAPGGNVDADDPAWSNGTMVRAFNNTLVPNALKDLLVKDARREVTFHSFRGAFKTLITMQRYGLQTNYAHEIVGHSKGALDRRYIREISIEQTYPAVRGCRYEGLVIPPAPALS